MSELLPGHWLAELDWLGWGLALIVGMPVAVVVLGEIAERLEGFGLAHYRKPLDLFRNSCLFLLFATILLRMVVGLPSSDLAVKIVDTLFWTSVLNAVLALTNAVMFGQGASDAQSKALKLLLDLGRFFVVAIGAALIVSYVWQVNLSGLLAALGVGSLVIGLALQDTLSNVFAGVTMLSAGQFRVGDWIKIGDVEGRVHAISWRSVSIVTLGGDIIVIPNNQFAKERLRVIGADAGRTYALVDVVIDHRYPPEHVRDALMEAALATKGLHPDAKPGARVAAYERLGLLYRVVLPLRAHTDIIPARDEFMSNFWYAANRAGITLRTEPLAYGEAAVDVAEVAMTTRLAALDTLARMPDSISRLAAIGRLERFRKGEVLIAAGQKGRAAHLILSGTAQAFGAMSDDRPVHVYGAGDFVLFKSFFRSGTAPLQVRCASDVEALRLPLDAFEEALAADAALAQQVERLFTQRDEAEAKLREPLLLDGEARGERVDRVKILKDLFMS